MKKVLILFLSVLMSIPAISVRAHTAASPKAATVRQGDGPILHFRIQIGRPKRQCTGFGICLIKIDVEPAPEPTEESGRVRATGRLENGRLRLEFERGSMDSATLENYFSTGSFRMEEDYPLPPEVAAALGISAYTIKAGNYPISAAGPDSATLPVAF